MVQTSDSISLSNGSVVCQVFKMILNIYCIAGPSSCRCQTIIDVVCHIAVCYLPERKLDVNAENDLIRPVPLQNSHSTI